MAKHGNIEILQWFYSYHTKMPRASATVFKVGDLVSLESNAAVNFNAVGEDATFAGLAVTEWASGDAGDVTIAPLAIVKIGCSSATYGYGAGLLYVSGSATAEYVVADDAGANTIFWCYQEYTSAVTRLVALVPAPIIQNLFSSAA